MRSLLLLLLGSPALAQSAATGGIRGFARSAEDGAAIPYALVQLLPAADEAPLRGVLTDAAGGFRFGEVPAGEYRLRLSRIGFDTSPSEDLRVHAGKVLEHDLRTRGRSGACTGWRSSCRSPSTPPSWAGSGSR